MFGFEFAGLSGIRKKLGALVLFIRIWGTLEFGTIIACYLRWNSNLTGMYVYFPGGLSPALLSEKNSEGRFKAPDLHEYMTVICAPRAAEFSEEKM